VPERTRHRAAPIVGTATNRPSFVLSPVGYTSVAAGTLSLQAAAVNLPAMTAKARLPVQAGTVNSLLLVAPGGGGSLHARFVLPSGAWLWAIVCCSLLGGGLGVANARRGRA
jgi:hypothetical protein